MWSAGDIVLFDALCLASRDSGGWWRKHRADRLIFDWADVFKTLLLIVVQFFATFANVCLLRLIVCVLNTAMYTWGLFLCRFVTSSSLHLFFPPSLCKLQ